MATTELLLTNVRVVRPDAPLGAEPEPLDIAVNDGTIARLAPNLPHDEAATVIDGRGSLAFPGVVDAHQHWGIYNELRTDARTESRASAQGGVTTSLTYMRTGQYYLNKGGPYREFFPEVLDAVQGNAHVDYAFHLAPMTAEHIEEIPFLVEEHGVTSFKIFMFYGGHGLHGRSTSQSDFLMTPPDERYDVAHFEFVMRGVQKARERLAEYAPTSRCRCTAKQPRS
ncbi:hypothetical protein ACFQHO_01330 [Actinomadura yumaensis]|uniref:hypothetical protein n=1 Tax=Actinomadura yumaensis TaxID=111807 RepID=UPI003609710B